MPCWKLTRQKRQDSEFGEPCNQNFYKRNSLRAIGRGSGSNDRRNGGYLLPLWTALPLQVAFELNCLASCKTPDAGLAEAETESGNTNSSTCTRAPKPVTVGASSAGNAGFVVIQTHLSFGF
jgi:hypothetical protein